MPSQSHAAVLTCHPDTWSQAVHAITVRVRWTETGELALTYTLKGEMTRLQIPPPRQPCRADRLWEHTCFEAFVSVTGKPEYYEFNFAPSGEWAVYSFRRYRDGEPVGDEEVVSRITMRGGGDRLDVEALVRLRRLQTMQLKTPLQLALSAVIEEKDGILSYWALKHPPGKPDFHHPEAFAMEMDTANGSTTEKR